MTELVIYAAVVLGITGLRSLPRWLVQRGRLSLFTNDPWYHLLLAEEISENRHRIPNRIRAFLLSTRLAYPPLMHWMMSFLPKGAREQVEPAWGGLCDGWAAAALAAVAIHAVPGGTVWTGGLAVLLFLATPGMMGTGWGPRALHGTPRVLGQLLFTLSALSLLLFRATGEWGWFAAAVFSGSLIFVTSFFSVQVFVLLNLLFAAFVWTWAPVVLVAAGFGLSLLWFPGYSLYLRREHMAMLQVMKRSLKQGGFEKSIQQRNRWAELRRLPDYLRKQPQRARQLLYKENTWLILLLQLPLVPVLFLLGGPAGGAGPGLLHDAGAYIWAGLAAFAATSLRPLLFLGEAERYVEHVVPLASLTLAFAAANASGWLAAALVALLLLYSAGASWWHGADFVRRGLQNQGRQEQIRETLEWIERHAAGKRFVVLPRNYMNQLIAYFTSGSVLFGRWRSDLPPDLLALRNPESAEFAQMRDGLFARFGIEYVVMAAWARNQPGMREMVAAYPEVFRNSEYVLLACRPEPSRAAQRWPAG